MKDKIIQFFSNLGRSLMMPIAALAACGIVLGLTSALLKAQVVAAVPFLGFAVVKFVILALNKLSAVVFTLIPVLFAISISLGLAKEDKEIAAFAGFIGYYAFLVGSSLVIATEVIDFSAMKISTILGVQTLDMGAIAGIIIGLLTAHLHNKYHKVEFPAAIAFYGGKRFVALVVILCSGLLGLVMPFIWAPVSSGINALGGLIDFFIWSVFQPGSNWYWVIVVGICYAAIYYFVFYSYLKKKNISIDVSVDDDSKVNEQTIPDNELFNTARTIISGLGGVENILVVNNCMSRLRVDVKDMSKVDDNVLKSTGSIGIIKPTDGHIQVIYGPKVEKIADKVRELLKY